MSAKSFITVIAALGVTLWLAVAGCGGGGQADPIPTAAFLKQGNSICAKATKEREAAMTEQVKEAGGNSAAELEPLVNEAALPALQNMVDELNGLGLPKGDEKQAEAILVGLEKGIEQIEAKPEMALGDPFRKVNEDAQDFELDECAV